MTNRVWRAALAVYLLMSTGNASAETSWVADDKGCQHLSEVNDPDRSVTWTGGCVDGRADGEGTQQWSVGGEARISYVGRLSEGQRQGRGLLRRPDGSTIESDFVDNNLTGPSVFTSPSGERYESQRPVVCTVVARPIPPVVRWTGAVMYTVTATVKDGKVVGMRLTKRDAEVPAAAERAFLAAIMAALKRYECPGDHVMGQAFAFHIRP